jgi:crossover junction endodeoxyribonuclease RuvC
MGTAQAAAAAVLAAAEAGLPIAWHTPSEVKAAVTGTGRAEKAQVAGMVVRILRLDSTPTPVDATDALALAICHVWRGSASARIEAAAAAAPPARIPRRRAGSAPTLPSAPAGGPVVVRSAPGSVGAAGRRTIGVRSGGAR